MKYTGAERMPLTLPTILKFVHKLPTFQRNIPQLQAAMSLRFLRKNNDFGGDP